MRIDRRFMQWGVFLIALGAVPLGVRLGWLDRSAVADAWRLWPVLLISIGLGILLARSRFHFVGGLLSSVTFGLILGGGLAAGIGGIGCVGGGSAATAFPARTGTFISPAGVDLTIDCGSVAVTTAAGSTWLLSGTGDASRLPAVSSTAANLVIASGGARAFLIFGAARSDWHLQLPTDPSLGVGIAVNAGNASLDLTGARIDELDLTTNAGSARVDLSRAASIDSLNVTLNAGDVLVALPSSALAVSATANAGKIGFCAQSGVGLRIETGGALSGNNFAGQGLIQDGKTWTSPGFATAQVRIVLQVTVNAGSVELNPDGGCR